MPEIDINTTVTTIDLLTNTQVIQIVETTAPSSIAVLASGVTFSNTIGSNDPGIGSSLTFPIAASTTLTTGKVCQLVNGELVLASIDDAGSAYSTIGVYDAATGLVVASGKLSFNAWNWTLGIPLFLGRNGDLVHVPLVDSPFYLQVAIPLTPTQIQVDIQQPIYL